MKKCLVLFFMLFVLLCGFCGCSNGVGLDDYLLIDAIGLDFEQNNVTVTVLFSDPDPQKSPEEQENDCTCISLNGVTVARALSELGNKTGKTPLYSQAGLLLIGKIQTTQLTEQRLDFFLREYTARCDILTAVSVEPAREIFKKAAEAGEQGVRDMLYMLNSCEKNGICPTVKFFQFMNLFLSETDCAYCPALTKSSETDGMKNLCEISGTAVFSNNGKKVVLLDTQQTKALLLLTHRAENIGLFIDSKHFTGSVRLAKSKIKTRLLPNESTPLLLEGHFSCELNEYKSENGGIGEREIKKAAEETAAYLCDLLSGVYQKLYVENQSDLCRFQKKQQLMLFNKAARSPVSVDEPCKISVSVRFYQTGKEQLKYGG